MRPTPESASIWLVMLVLAINTLSATPSPLPLTNTILAGLIVTPPLGSSLISVCKLGLSGLSVVPTKSANTIAPMAAPMLCVESTILVSALKLHDLNCSKMYWRIVWTCALCGTLGSDGTPWYELNWFAPLNTTPEPWSCPLVKLSIPAMAITAVLVFELTSTPPLKPLVGSVCVLVQTKPDALGYGCAIPPEKTWSPCATNGAPSTTGVERSP